MKKRQILNRIETLRNAIAYSRFTGSYMSVGQGICCNQEVASWYKVLERMSLTDTTEGTAIYTIPQALEEKVFAINKVIKQINWVKPEII